MNYPKYNKQGLPFDKDYDIHTVQTLNEMYPSYFLTFDEEEGWVGEDWMI